MHEVHLRGNSARKSPKWIAELLREIEVVLADDVHWKRRLTEAVATVSSTRIHLAIFVEPFLSYIFDGSKTVESRFSITRRAPYEEVFRGDIIVLKRAGGAVCGICAVKNVWSYSLDPETWKEIRDQFAGALCANGDEFWDQRRAAKFATLMLVSDVRSLKPISISKQDRRGWVVLHS